MAEPARARFAQSGFRGRIGVGRRDITPPAGIFFRSWGPSTLDTPRGVHRPMSLTALVLDDGSQQPLIVVSADLGWWQQVRDEWRVREPLLDALGVPEARVLLHLTHTHSGPSICTDESHQPGGSLIGPYLDSVAQAAISAAKDAMDGARPGTLEWASGVCDLAVNRDLPDGDRFICGFNPAGISDTTLVVGRACDEHGRLIATLVNYACHPTTLAWQNDLISPDYVGAMRELVESATDSAPCLFLQGASGDLAPREGYVGDTDVPDRHGRKLGYAVLATLTGMLAPETALVHAETIESGAPLALWAGEHADDDRTLAASHLKVPVELKEIPTVAALAERWRGIDEHSMRERLARAGRLHAVYANLDPPTHPAWIWRIGDAVLVAHPGEAYSVFQRTLRARYPERTVIVMNITNGPGWVYLPPREVYESDRYPVWQTVLAPGTLERFEAACVRELDALLGGC